MHPIKVENPLNLITQKCTLGCPILDHLLDGGVPCNSITELVAESGCGKTQLCLQLLLCAQLPASRGGLGAASFYIHSEFPFPLRRLRQLSLSFPHPTAMTPWTASLSMQSEFDNKPSDLKRRSSLFFGIAGKLKSIAKRFSLAIVVTNQVVDLIDSDGANGLQVGNFGYLYSSGRRVCPALGLSWANCINSRLFLSRCKEAGTIATSGSEDQSCGELGVMMMKRRMQVVFAPHLPESSCEFVIVREGVFGVGS
ncbi:DNA repair protein XRCC3 [Cinnamomum micranthum f. kanehirae]|uniref:DNA repair protein XRCC3 n=1 Tax=Cinnamomum micranthum f. kanehirae TaxID=337451 RepID=A0A443PKT9_9MAGN|nr:DNA repair protein XRCC3 [Cinnamomum micranthum f. kanehirae]